MTNAWFFQANPKLYNIDAALAQLDRIWWRVPQYTSELRIGDAVVIWRSGANAGVVGVGRIMTEPQARAAPDPSELPFIRNNERESATEVCVQVRPTEPVLKDAVRALPTLTDHPVIIAPMGTVFPIDDDGWAELSSLIATPPDIPGNIAAGLPPAFHWRDRVKGVGPMPGGYDGYLQSLRSICQMIDAERPSQPELAPRLEEMLGISPTGARYRESFLRRIGVIEVDAGVAGIGYWARRWLECDEDAIIIGLLHSRCQLIGELLRLCELPHSTDELLAAANESHGMGWDTRTQIDNRRGWLQSAGMVSALDDSRIHITDKGRTLLNRLELHEPAPPREPPRESHGDQVSSPVIKTETPDGANMNGKPAQSADRLNELLAELRDSCTDSADPDRFEKAAAAAFDFLGFRSEWLGGAGKTDVLLDALIGRDESYRVIVDCKTSASGSVHDQQVDWVTLSDHRRQHSADHVALVAPNPSGARMFERARQHHVVVISAHQLIGICRQHARSPLGLAEYQELFRAGGAADTGGIDERAADIEQLVSLAAKLFAAIETRSETFGRLTARDLYLILAGDPVAEGTSEDQIQLVLDGLSNPVIGIIDGTSSTGYRISSNATNGRLRLRILGDRLSERT